MARQRGLKSKSGPARRRSVRIKKSLPEPRCRIAILGVGGAGNRIVSHLVDKAIAGTRCIAVNTDLKDLDFTNATQKVLIGEKVTCGLSAGGNPETGKAAAQESKAIIESLVDNVDVAFVVAGLGGGTGTGAAPVVAEIARRKGAVVVGVLATPFRMNEYRSGFIAEALGAMRLACDTLVVADNDRIRRAVANLSAGEAREAADQYLVSMVRGIAENLSEPSMINLDFADFKTIVKEGGVATYGIGESNAPNRAEEAVQNALNTSLFNVDCADATGVLIQVSGDPRMTVQEVDRVKELVEDRMGRGARVAWGARVNPTCEGSLKVTVVMTGVNLSYVRWGLSNMLNELYDLESSYSVSQKSLPVDLGLDQIEGAED